MKRTTSTLFSTNPSKKLKPIQLITYINNDDMNTVGWNANAKSIASSLIDVASDGYERIYSDYRLISRGERYDIIAAWPNESKSERNVAVFAGYWNDGVLPDA